MDKAAAVSTQKSPRKNPVSFTSIRYSDHANEQAPVD
jgi:hypothetical protein